MAESVGLGELTRAASQIVDRPRHSAVVRVTHWITALSFLVLLLSGIAILLAHPRLYWGETGAVGGPSLIDLPLPFVLDVPIRGPGRYLHFLFGWIAVLTGLFYVLYGVFSRHFLRNLWPAASDLKWQSVAQHLRLRRPGREEALRYNVVQRVSYLAVVFVFFPLMILTGLAMSPAVTSVFPIVVEMFGGQQSARTIHFFVSLLLVVFVVVHIFMVFVSGFAMRMRAMITRRGPSRSELS